ncbi:4-hydroxybutyrate CoA-transferase [Roseomonas sp. NAR14]|uniref:4-hydroxybutyrate CoA-transferase n=1 Tax=Roseomonas acroporae TaxID=2937791 RepID=A0A9X1Y868_9PROT|nr:acetyl-CoA hydrolase/transferase C-terminal domain-containing protein [Roseomonas acroporae]MCK8785929.1 4-hydroxybutyrate CoA-transferase [Roseomonas acroporae]
MQRLDPAAPALRGLIRPGDRILWGQAAGEPPTLVEALVDQRAALGGVSVLLGTGLAATLRPEHADHIAMQGIGGLGTTRALANAGVLDILPLHGGQVGRMLAEGRLRCDVALLMLPPAGPDGAHSLGCTVDYMDMAVAQARTVIAEVSPRVPCTLGHAAIPAARLDAVLETDRAPLGTRPPRIGEAGRRIAAHVAALVADSSTIQVGLGELPEAILDGFAAHRDLGLHSGIFGDAAMRLLRAGVLTNARKPIDAGVSVATTAVGTAALYDFVHRNPAVALRPCGYTHADAVLARLPRLVAINAAAEVDLTGQVNAEQAGRAVVGGIGGQADFARAASRSPGGCSVIALPALASTGGTRIVHRLSGPVTTPRADVDVVVTEHGAADLRGCGLAERRRRLIGIAAPECREALERAVREEGEA